MARLNGGVPTYSVTSAGVNPTEDRAHRIRMYFIAMSLRVLCVVSLFWLRGWWVLVPVLGAIVFPWFAVMIGNAVAYGGERKLDAPEPQQLSAGEANVEVNTDAQGADLLVVDVDPVRRATEFTYPSDTDPDDSEPGRTQKDAHE